MDAADFYTGIVAELYGPLKSFSQDPKAYAAFIEQSGTRRWSWAAGMAIPY
ncbi:hypothetical protein ACFQY7_11190 [Actinomadura luteofluorescens]|uniref:hypothetical protein n=1 Tax=Actinomadura luteofluorescens TaxID=46163 RepID=UPI00362C274E